MVKLWNLSALAVVVSAVLSIAMARAAFASVPSDDVPEGLKAAIQADVENRGHEYERESSLIFVFENGVWASQGSTGDEPLPTPSVTQEWAVEGVEVSGSTVTVSIRVFAGIDVGVTLHGAVADETTGSAPILEFVFLDVPDGQHEVLVKDVVGFQESILLTVLGGEGPDSTGDFDAVPAALLAAIEAEADRRGYAYAGLCKDVPDDGASIGKHCANVSNLTADSADVSFAPYATDEFTSVAMVFSDGVWELSAPGAPNTGSGLVSKAGFLSNVAFASAIALMFAGSWLLGRAGRPPGIRG